MSDRGLLAAVDVSRDIDRYSAQVVANDSNSATSCPQLAEEGESLRLAEGIRRQVAITVQRGARRVIRIGVVIRIRVPLPAIEAQVVPTNRLAGLSQVSGQFGRSGKWRAMLDYPAESGDVLALAATIIAEIARSPSLPSHRLRME